MVWRFSWAPAAVLLLIAAVLSHNTHCVSAEHSFEVFRLAQLLVNGEQRGSQAAKLALQATAVREDGSGGGKNGKLTRNVVVLSMLEAAPSFVVQLVEERKAGGVLILLPEQGSVLTDDELTAFHELEVTLLDRVIPVPVYFTFLDEELSDMYQTLKNTVSGSGVPATDNYQLTVTAKKPLLISDTSGQNLQAWLPGAAQGDDELDTIAVVAHYDSFSAAPTMATGVDSNGSGTAALLELARLFSVLYEGSRTQGKYNLLFTLTDGGHRNFAGAKAWVESLDDKTADSIAFVLCLDTIGTDGELVLHTSKKRSARSVSDIFDAFESVAQQLGVPLRIQQTKVNLAVEQVSWEHEQFARERIPAATVSALQEPRTGLQRSRIFDDGQRLNEKVLKRNVQFVAEALAMVVYGDGKFPLFQGSLVVDHNHVSAWTSLFASTPRSPVAKSTSTAVTDALFNELRVYSTDANRQTFQFPPKETVFFTAGEGADTMVAYRVKPISFDVFLLLGVSAYCLVLAIALQGKDAFQGILAPAKKSKREQD